MELQILNNFFFSVSQLNFQVFKLSYSADMDDFGMTYGNCMNAFEKCKCREKHPVSRANNCNTKKVIIAR